MKLTPICFKKKYGSERFYLIMLKIKKEYPLKQKFSDLIIFFPIYQVMFSVLEVEFERIRLEFTNEWLKEINYKSNS